MRRRMLIVLLLSTLLSPMMAARASGETTVYSGGLIYGKAGTAPIEVVVVENGQFSYVGSLEGALRAKAASALTWKGA